MALPAINTLNAIGIKNAWARLKLIYPKNLKVNIDRIRYIEARGNYVYIHDEGKNIISLQSMGDIQAQLPTDGFVRVHKSFIVSISHIEVIESHQVVVSDTEIPVGATYREHFKQVIGGLKERNF